MSISRATAAQAPLEAAVILGVGFIQAAACRGERVPLKEGCKMSRKAEPVLLKAPHKLPMGRRSPGCLLDWTGCLGAGWQRAASVGQRRHPV